MNAKRHIKFNDIFTNLSKTRNNIIASRYILAIAPFPVNFTLKRFCKKFYDLLLRSENFKLHTLYIITRVICQKALIGNIQNKVIKNI